MRRWKHIWEISDRPLCEAEGWVPYGKSGWNGYSTGSKREQCYNPAEYKDGGRFVCNKHAKKKHTPLKVAIDYRDGLITIDKIIIHRAAGIIPE